MALFIVGYQKTNRNEIVKGWYIGRTTVSTQSSLTLLHLSKIRKLGPWNFFVDTKVSLSSINQFSSTRKSQRYTFLVLVVSKKP